MTKQQKEQIQQLRQSGTSLKAIALALNLSVNTVKSYCTRNRIEVKTPIKNVKKCKNCGKVIIAITKTKPRVFCSENCKLTWWRKHKQQHKSRFIAKFVCQTCGKVFQDYKCANRKYCSEKCYQRRNSNG